MKFKLSENRCSEKFKQEFASELNPSFYQQRIVDVQAIDLSRR